MQFSKWVTLVFGALCLVAVAGVLNAQHLYYMAAILLTLPAISYLLGWYALRGLTFTRELPPTCWEGEEANLVYAAVNSTPVARFFLTVHENLPSWIKPLDSEAPLFNVGANETARVAHRVLLSKRGVYRAESFDVTAMDPLGVFAFTSHVVCPAEVVVYPMPLPIQSMALSGAERYGFQDFTSQALRGGSVDPDGVRQYVPGDALRRIHWRQTARTGKLSVMEFEETQSVNLVIALDLHRETEIGAGAVTTLEYAVRLSASLSQQAIQHGATVRLITQTSADTEGGSFVATTAGRGQSHMYYLLDTLARVEADSHVPLQSVIADQLGALLPGTTLVVITSRPDVGLAAALARYTAVGANVLVVYVDPEGFARGRGVVRLADAQSFFTELVSVSVHIFLLRYNADNDLIMEAYSHTGESERETTYAAVKS